MDNLAPFQALIERFRAKLTAEERAGASPPGFVIEADEAVVEPDHYGADAPERPAWMTAQEQGWAIKGFRRLR